MEKSLDKDIEYLKGYKYDNEVKQAIENVLADRERLINNEMEKIFSDNQIREYQKKHYISKDKIKAKIEEHTRIKNDYMFNELKCHMEVEKGIIKVLEELIGE